VLDNGETYPHHNLYFIQSDDWDLEVLGGLLMSTIGQFFVESYGVRMRGGYAVVLAGLSSVAGALAGLL
jgi:adenine-specific DNA-methyltransferase